MGTMVTITDFCPVAAAAIWLASTTRHYRKDGQAVIRHHLNLIVGWEASTGAPIVLRSDGRAEPLRGIDRSLVLEGDLATVRGQFDLWVERAALEDEATR